MMIARNQSSPSLTKNQEYYEEIKNVMKLSALDQQHSAKLVS